MTEGSNTGYSTMPVEITIGGPVLALRKALDESQTQLRTAGGEAASLQATIRRHERTEQVLKESLLAAQNELGLTQTTASNLHELLAELRRTAAADRAASTRDREARAAAEAGMEALQTEVLALRSEMAKSNAKLGELASQLAHNQAHADDEGAQVRECDAGVTHRNAHTHDCPAGC